MTCTQITREEIAKISNNDLQSLHEDAAELGFSEMKEAVQREWYKRGFKEAQAMWGWISAQEKLPEDGAKVIVAGGVAQYRGGQWFSGMEEPLYTRPLEWEVTHWRHLDWPPEAYRGEAA